MFLEVIWALHRNELGDVHERVLAQAVLALSPDVTARELDELQRQDDNLFALDPSYFRDLLQWGGVWRDRTIAVVRMANGWEDERANILQNGAKVTREFGGSRYPRYAVFDTMYTGDEAKKFQAIANRMDTFMLGVRFKPEWLGWSPRMPKSEAMLLTTFIPPLRLIEASRVP